MFINNEYFNSGFTANQAGSPETANPLLHDAQPCKLWVCGWTYGELIKHEEQLNSEPLTRIDKSPHEQGKLAQLKGSDRDSNPYDPETPDWFNWDTGWNYSNIGDTEYKANNLIKLPIINQHNVIVGQSYFRESDRSQIEGYTDDNGNQWTPPTAWAWFAVCRALRRLQERK